jgi:hypothetical protein
MKNRFFLLVLFTNFIVAQKPTKKVSRFGVHLGFGYNTQVKESKVIAPVSFGYHNRFTPNIGVVFKDSINSFLFFRTGLYYTQRGVKFNYVFDTPFYYLKSINIFTGHYASFPITLNFKYKRFYIGGGLEGSILIKAHYYFYAKQIIPPGPTIESEIDRWFGAEFFQPVDAGFRFNMGYKFLNMEVDLNIFHGLLPPPKFQYFTSQHFEFKYAYQQTFSLQLNYYFKVKKWNKPLVK